MLAAVASYFAGWFATDVWPVRLIAAAFTGVVVYGMAVIALVVAMYFASRLAGEPEPPLMILEVPSALTGAALLVVALWFLGQHWVARQTSSVQRCVEEQQGEIGPGRLFSTPSELVYQCLHPEDISSPMDDE